MQTRVMLSKPENRVLEGMAELNNNSQPVSRPDLESLLDSLEAQPGDAREGFFGPRSASWRVNRESAVFLGAGRAALLQIAHPWVATALAQHSDLLHDAIGRFHSTFRVVYTMVFRSRAQALAASRRLYSRHTSVRGELPSALGAHPRGERYEANEVGALLWVHATLVESAVLAYELTLGPLPPDERELYYAESRSMAGLFGIPNAALPPDWRSFREYTAAMLASPVLAVDANGRALGASVLSGAGTRIHPPDWYRALTAGWLPEQLREGFGLAYGPSEQRAVRRAARWLPWVYHALPGAARFVGPWHEAQARLRGRAPGALTRANNRFWMGRERMLYPHPGK